MSLDKLTDRLLNTVADEDFGRFKAAAEGFRSDKEEFKNIMMAIAIKDITPIRIACKINKNPYEIYSLALCIAYIACNSAMGFTKDDLKTLLDDVWDKCQGAFDVAADEGLPINKEFIDAGLADPNRAVKDSKWGKT